MPSKKLKILFIPFIKTKTSERIPQIIKILSRHYNIIGVAPVKAIFKRGGIHWILSRIRLLNLFFKALKLSLKARPDLIFCEEPEYTLVGLMISKIIGKPVIYDTHGNRYLLCKRLNSRLRYLFYAVPLDIFLAKKSAVLLVVSEHNKQFYIDQGIPPRKIHVIPSCIDLTEVDKSRIGSSKYLETFRGKKTLLFFGTFDYQPNLEALCFINEELAPAIDDLNNVEIYICGRASERVMRLIGNFHRKVKWVGFVQNIYEILYAIDVFICPLWRTVGIIVKVLDAMSAGKPIIASEFVAEGIPELKSFKACLARNKEEFICLVRRFIENFDEYKSLGHEFRKIVESKYSSKVVEQKLQYIINELGRKKIK